MRILHATKRYPNSAGGDATVVKSLERVQRKAGHDIVILTSNCREIIDAKHVRKFGLGIQSHDIDTINVIRIVSLAWLSVRSFWLLKQLKPDIIHSHSMDLGFFMRPAARLYKIPVINTCHGTSIGKADFAKAKKSLELFFLRAGKFDRIITVDEPSLNAFAKAGLHDVVYVPNGVEEATHKTAWKRKHAKTTILFVGRLERVKGVPDLLQAFGKLKNKESLELVFVGEGGDGPKLRQQARELGIFDHTVFMGRQDPDVTRKVMQDADIFVLPSHYEGFPIVMLEAWAAGLPVVVSKVGAMQTVCRDGENALLIPPKKSVELAKALERLIADKKLQKKLGVNGRKLVDTTYNYDAVYERVQTVYDEVLA